MSIQKNNGEESKEPDYDEDNNELEENQEEEPGEQETTNQIFESSLGLLYTIISYQNIRLFIANLDVFISFSCKKARRL